jgi:cysteine desulfurase
MAQAGAIAPPIYLDHHATTPLDPRVLDAMLPWFTDDFGNAASTTHSYGWRAEAAVDDARERIARAIGAASREIIFTSGATESNNLAILGAAEATARKGAHFVTLATEHSSVLDPLRHLEKQGHPVTWLDVDRDGLVDVARIAAAIRDDTLLVSVMAANNEIGVLQPLGEIGAICRARGVLFHTDAAQATGRIDLDVDRESVDLLSISAHKLYGPKGVGALFVRARRPRARIAPRQFGGGHERGLRPGTLPVPLIVGMASALELCIEERDAENVRLRALRDRLHERIRRSLDGVRLNGHAERRLAANLNLAFEGVDGAKLLLALGGVAVSSGSACSSAKPEPSHVLVAIGVPEPQTRASLRFGLGRGTRADDVDRAADLVIEAVRKQRAS